jgi:NDP-sugar pyrophosphorylase family protein
MFPTETKIIFICNKDHLEDPVYQLKETLKRACPSGIIVAIEPHRRGPVHAVLQAQSYIDLNLPTVINYCDFSCYWNWPDFKNFVQDTKCTGAIPAYRGFHPHSLGSTLYAYLREDGDLWATDIQEKMPFTSCPANEYASSGTYYFESADIMFWAFNKMIEQDLSVNGEFYVSMAYKPLFEIGKKIAIYELQHFMQWGTPQDLLEYQQWSNLFRNFVESPKYRALAKQDGTLLIPMAGLGSRFAKEGYSIPKPLIEVDGVPMVVRAALDMPQAEKSVFVTRSDLPGNESLTAAIGKTIINNIIVSLPSLTEGQAHTCLLAIDYCNPDEPVTIAPCDSGTLFCSQKFQDKLKKSDLIVWGYRGHSTAKLKSTSYSWIDVNDDESINYISVKRPLKDPTTDPIVIGAFTFKRADNFIRATKLLMSRNQRVNGEFYIDAVVNIAIEMGLNVQMLEVDYYIGWGTPDEYKTFKYWQSCFHKWRSHPYRLEADLRVGSHARCALEEEYKEIVPKRPL